MNEHDEDPFELNLDGMVEEPPHKSTKDAAPDDAFDLGMGEFGEDGFPGETIRGTKAEEVVDFDAIFQEGNSAHDGSAASPHGGFEHPHDGQVAGEGFVLQDDKYEDGADYIPHHGDDIPQGDAGGGYEEDAGEYLGDGSHDDYEAPVKKKTSFKTLLLAGVAAIAVVGVVGTLMYKKHESHEHRPLHKVESTIPAYSAPSAPSQDASVLGGVGAQGGTTSLPMALPDSSNKVALPSTGHDALPPTLNIKPVASTAPQSENPVGLPVVPAAPKVAPSTPASVDNAIKPVVPASTDKLSAPASLGNAMKPVDAAPTQAAVPVKQDAKPDESAASSQAPSLPSALSPVTPLVPQGVATSNGKAPPLPSAVADMMGAKNSIPAGATSNSGITETPLPMPPPAAGNNAQNSVQSSSVSTMPAADDASLEQKTAYMRGLINLMQNEIITLHTEIGTMQQQQKDMQASIVKNRADVDKSIGAVNTSIATIGKAQSDDFAKLEKAISDKKVAANTSSAAHDNSQILTGYRLVAVSKAKDEIERISDGKHFVVEMGHDIPGAGIAQKTAPYMKPSANGDEQSWELITSQGRIIP